MCISMENSNYFGKTDQRNSRSPFHISSAVFFPHMYSVFLLNINEGTTLKCSEKDNQVVRRVGIRLVCLRWPVTPCGISYKLSHFVHRVFDTSLFLLLDNSHMGWFYRAWHCIKLDFRKECLIEPGSGPRGTVCLSIWGDSLGSAHPACRLDFNLHLKWNKQKTSRWEWKGSEITVSQK